jgi:hypothetical protein
MVQMDTAEPMDPAHMIIYDAITTGSRTAVRNGSGPAAWRRRCAPGTHRADAVCGSRQYLMTAGV